jgi:RTX calcium-binding nonapeptide repeat (4 copies)
VSLGRAAIAAALPAVVGAALALLPAPAVASGPAATAASTLAAGEPLTRGLSDGRLLANADPALRAAGIAVTQRIGGSIARLPIGWSTVVANETFAHPDESVVPLSDPAHPVYRWDRIDASVRDLAAANLTPLAYLMAAPPWAQSAPRYAYSTPGTWAPRPADVAAFASAVARRYDGTYPDPLEPGAALPRIRHFQTWNEPNLARYLGPQWVPNHGRPQLFSARWYRRMHAAAYAAIHTRQPDAVVGLAGLAPTGADVDGAGRVGPIRFLRSLLCLGEARELCGAPLPFDAIALHPLSVGDPDRPARNADDLALADLQPKLERILADARADGRLRTGPPPALWITELNWTSAEAGGIAATDQAAVVGRAMLRLHAAGASVVNWQFATDPPTDRTAGEERPAGLTVNAPGDPRRLPGQEKAFAAGFAFPVAAIALGRSSTYVWALVPRRAASRRAHIEVRRGDVWQEVSSVPISADGVAAARVEIPSGKAVRIRIGAVISPVVRSTLRLRLQRRRSAPIATAASARRGVTLLAARAMPGLTAAPDDPRLGDDAGPGFFPPVPPLLPGGTPPTPSGRRIPPLASPTRPARRLHFTGTRGADVIIGSSGADRITGAGGADLLIGMGGDDRFGASSDAASGATLIVRGRRIERR